MQEVVCVLVFVEKILGKQKRKARARGKSEIQGILHFVQDDGVDGISQDDDVDGISQDDGGEKTGQDDGVIGMNAVTLNEGLVEA